MAVCQKCRGLSSDYMPCFLCDSTGSVDDQAPKHYGPAQNNTDDTCPKCSGLSSDYMPCPACDSTGVYTNQMSVGDMKFQAPTEFGRKALTLMQQGRLSEAALLNRRFLENFMTEISILDRSERECALQHIGGIAHMFRDLDLPMLAKPWFEELCSYAKVVVGLTNDTAWDLCYLADCLLQVGNTKAAQAALSEGAAVGSPDDAALQEMIGQIEKRLSKVSPNTGDLNMDVEELASQSREWWMDMGTIKKERGEFVEAEAFYRGAVAKDRDYGDAWFNLGSLLLLELRRPEDAAYCLRQAIRCDPSDEVAKRYLRKAEALCPL